MRKLPAATLIFTLLAAQAASAQADAKTERTEKMELAIGGSLNQIASELGVSTEMLATLNPGIDPLHLQEKQVIRVPSEAAIVMYKIGIDYENLFAAAKKNPRALPIFMAQSNTMDGAAAEMFSDDLRTLMEIHGDAVFAAALGTFSKGSQQVLFVCVLDDMGIQPPKAPSGKVWDAFRKNYPLTAALYTHP